MITIKTSTILKDFKGQPLKSGENDLTIGEVISTVLAGKSTNPTLSWVFGKKFATEKAVDLKAEDVVFIKEQIEKDDNWFAVVKGQVIELLDSPTPKNEDK